MAKSSSRKSDRPGTRFPRKQGTVFSGVLIGLIVGAILAVGIAFWVATNNPFKTSRPDGGPSDKPQTVVEDAPEPAPSYDFYKVLPSDAPGDIAPSQPAAAATPLYYLQAGAFQNAADADNMKAQLAMLGVEADIQTRDLGEKGIFHRVRIGPFRAMDEINRTRSLLTQNEIQSALVKEIPNSQETP